MFAFVSPGIACKPSKVCVQAWLEGQAGEAAAGRVPGGGPMSRLGRGELRSAVAIARKSCGELRSKTIFYQVGLNACVELWES